MLTMPSFITVSIQSGLSVRTDNNEDNQKKEKEGRHASMQTIIKYDRETNRLMVLRGPFTVAASSKAFYDAVTLAIVSQNLGVDALSAFVIVNLCIGITDQFVKGVADSLNTVSTLNDVRLRDTSLSLKWLRAGSTSCNA
jgi:glycosylphosphatidylinositol transamidase (GPIT) subunit GPI8